MKKQLKTTWFDVYLGKYKWYHKLIGGIWYKHELTAKASLLTFVEGQTFWARYGLINDYSRIIQQETVNGFALVT